MTCDSTPLKRRTPLVILQRDAGFGVARVLPCLGTVLRRGFVLALVVALLMFPRLSWRSTPFVSSNQFTHLWHDGPGSLMLLWQSQISPRLRIDYVATAIYAVAVLF
jgi:hypothetical protein